MSLVILENKNDVGTASNFQNYLNDAITLPANAKVSLNGAWFTRGDKIKIVKDVNDRLVWRWDILETSSTNDVITDNLSAPRVIIIADGIYTYKELTDQIVKGLSASTYNGVFVHPDTMVNFKDTGEFTQGEASLGGWYNSSEYRNQTNLEQFATGASFGLYQGKIELNAAGDVEYTKLTEETIDDVSSINFIDTIDNGFTATTTVNTNSVTFERTSGDNYNLETLGRVGFNKRGIKILPNTKTAVWEVDIQNDDSTNAVLTFGLASRAGDFALGRPTDWGSLDLISDEGSYEDMYNYTETDRYEIGFKAFNFSKLPVIEEYLNVVDGTLNTIEFSEGLRTLLTEDMPFGLTVEDLQEFMVGMRLSIPKDTGEHHRVIKSVDFETLTITVTANFTTAPASGEHFIFIDTHYVRSFIHNYDKNIPTRDYYFGRGVYLSETTTATPYYFTVYPVDQSGVEWVASISTSISFDDDSSPYGMEKTTFDINYATPNLGFFALSGSGSGAVENSVAEETVGGSSTTSGTSPLIITTIPLAADTTYHKMISSAPSTYGQTSGGAIFHIVNNGSLTDTYWIIDSVSGTGANINVNIANMSHLPSNTATYEILDPHSIRLPPGTILENNTYKLGESITVADVDSGNIILNNATGRSQRCLFYSIPAEVNPVPDFVNKKVVINDESETDPLPYLLGNWSFPLSPLASLPQLNDVVSIYALLNPYDLDFAHSEKTLTGKPFVEVSLPRAIGGDINWLLQPANIPASINDELTDQTHFTMNFQFCGGFSTNLWAYSTLPSDNILVDGETVRALSAYGNIAKTLGMKSFIKTSTSFQDSIGNVIQLTGTPGLEQYEEPLLVNLEGIGVRSNLGIKNLITQTIDVIQNLEASDRSSVDKLYYTPNYPKFINLNNPNPININSFRIKLLNTLGEEADYFNKSQLTLMFTN